MECEKDGSEDEEEAKVPFSWNSSPINKSPSKDVESRSLPEKRYSNNGHKKEFIRNNSLTNDNVIKDYDNLLNKQDEIHKSEKSDSSSVSNSKKWDKFKSQLKRTFQTEDCTSPALEIPNKLSKLDSSLPTPLNNTEKEDNLGINNEKNVDESENTKTTSLSSSSPTPSSPGSSHNSPKSSSSLTLPLKHRHYHLKKAMAAASSSTTTTTTSTTNLTSTNNNNNGNSNNKETSVQEKDKKNVSESTTPPPTSTGTPSKSNNKKKQKRK